MASHGGEGAWIEGQRFLVLQWATMEKVLRACPDVNYEQLKNLVDESGKILTSYTALLELFFFFNCSKHFLSNYSRPVLERK